MKNIVYEKMALGSGALRVMLKDTINIKGYKTVGGSAALLDTQPANEHADIVNHILNHDCQITGKTNLHELAFGTTGINHFTGTATNPKYPELIPGGSSSGSAAAVAANLVDFSVGTDTGGSIRMPAACCGIYGLKPTFGRVSRQGVLPESTSLDCVGPFAASLSALTQAMAIIDPTFQYALAQKDQIQSLRLAVLDVEAKPEIWQTVNAFLTQAGFSNPAQVKLSYFSDAYRAGMQVINYETWQAFGHLVASGKVGQDVANRLLNAAKTTLDEVELANQVRQSFTQEIDQLLNEYDVLVLPTLPQTPPKVADAEDTTAFLNMTALIRPFNLSGHPAITLPLETQAGLPAGVQLVGQHGADEKLCAIAAYLMDLVQSKQQGEKE